MKTPRAFYQPLAIGAPAPLREQLGGLEFVFEVDLSSPRKLARADAARVRASLLEAGYYLQLPPRHPDALDGRG